MTKLYSHPDYELEVHLNNVGIQCSKNILLSNYNYSNSTLAQHLPNIGYICGIGHDIGKATKNFQHYLKNNEIIGPKNHALISALCCYEMIKLYLKQNDLIDEEYNLVNLYAFIAVKRHHGVLKNIKDELLIKSKKSELEEILDNFYEDELQQIIDNLTKPINIKFCFISFKNEYITGNFIKELAEIEYLLDFENSNNAEPFFINKIIYSSLLYADKQDVIIGAQYCPKLKSQQNKATNYTNHIESYKKNNLIAKNQIDVLKNNAYLEATSALEGVFKLDHHLYSITLPTGLGKTITSFGIASKIKELYDQINNKIIIGIPFTSIIDQNYAVLASITNTDNTNELLKHHHLSDPKYKILEDELEPSKGNFLIESWESNIVVTTFVQLIDSLYSNDKAKALKFANISNSIIILDEIQTLPYEYWKLINQTLKCFGKLYNCYFILMTATQPSIFKQGTEIIELIPNCRSYFDYFNRTQLNINIKTAIKIEIFIEYIKEYIKLNPKKDVLIIVNTKKTCLEIFQEIVSHYQEESKEIYYLSTLITPYERKQIISKIKEKSKTTKQKIIVSTQLVEAGVDISVNTIFRELAPLDSIIQAAGRANRYNEFTEPSDVFIYKIDGNAKTNNIIYGTILMNTTENLLLNENLILESSYLALIDKYYIKIADESKSIKSDELAQLNSLAFKDLGAFSLIKAIKTESIFIQINLEAKAIWNDYVNIFSRAETTAIAKHIEFEKIKNKFYDYVINIAVYENIPIDFDGEKTYFFYVSEFEHPSQYYSYDPIDFTKNKGYCKIQDAFL